MRPWKNSAQDARKAWSGSGDAATEDVWFGLREETGATEFLGYEAEAAEGVVSGHRGQWAAG